MRFKKTMLVGATLALINLPVLAHADLNTVNKTPNDSAVAIAGKCTGPSIYTPAGGSKSFPSIVVNSICKGVSPCVAEVYADKNCSPDQKIATAYYVLSEPQYLKQVDPEPNAKFVITSDSIGTNTITIVPKP